MSKRSASPSSTKRSSKSSERADSSSSSNSQRRSSRKNARRSSGNNNMHIISGLGLGVIVLVILIIMKMSSPPPKATPTRTRDGIGQAEAMCNDAMREFSKNRDSAPAMAKKLTNGRTLFFAELDKLPEATRSRYDRILLKINMSLKDMRERAIIVNARQGH